MVTAPPSAEILIDSLELFATDYYSFVNEHPLLVQSLIESPTEGLGPIPDLLDDIQEASSKLSKIDPDVLPILYNMLRVQRQLFISLVQLEKENKENYNASLHNAAHVLDCLKQCQKVGIDHTNIAREAVRFLSDKYFTTYESRENFKVGYTLLAKTLRDTKAELETIQEAVKRCPSLTKPTLAENVEYACAMAQRGQDLYDRDLLTSRPSFLKRVLSFFTRH
jgi:hypothetical protein